MVTPLAPYRNERDSLGGGSEVTAPVFVSQSGFLPFHDVPDCRASAVGSCCWPTDAHGSHSTGARAGDPLHASPCNPSLTRRMLNAMRFIQGYQEAHGVGPTYEEIAVRFSMSSKGNAHWLVRRLIERGYMEFGPFKTKKRREVIILRPVPIPRFDSIPLQFIPLEGI